MEKMLRKKSTIALFVLPALIIFAVFMPIPLVASLGLSAVKWDLINPAQMVGLDNFINLFTNDETFLRSIGNTLQYLVLSVLFQIPLAFLLAVMVTRGKLFEKFFRNMLFIPVTLSGTAVSLMFYFVYHPETGILNNIIRLFGNKDFQQGWLGDENTAMISVCVAVAWQFVGYHMVIFVTGITSISEEVIEAAKIDGASMLQVILRIILPLMRPVLKVSLVLITTSSLKAFDSIFVMTGGGPMHATEVMASHMYTKSFLQLQYGYGSAIGVVLFLLCVVCSGVISRLLRTEDE